MTVRMTKRARTVLTALSLLVVSALLAGCGSSSLKIGWREFSGGSRKRANYVTFDGVQSRTLRVEGGKRIELSCDVTVEKGTLWVSLISPGGDTLWGETFEEDRHAFASTTASEGGLYILRIEGDGAGGGFDISWDVKG